MTYVGNFNWTRHGQNECEKVAEKNYDETDRRLISALHDVEVPADLETRLQQALRAAAQSELSQAVGFIE